MRNEIQFNVEMAYGVEITYRELASGNKYARVSAHTRSHADTNKELYEALMRSNVGTVQHYTESASGEFSTVSLVLGRLEIVLFGDYMADEIPAREQDAEVEAEVEAVL